MIRICLSGARGRMGTLLLELIERADDLELASALERSGHPDLGLELPGGSALTDDADSAIPGAEVLLDFSLPASVCAHAQVAAAAGRGLVSGTTGFDDEQRGILRTASGRIPVVLGSNMSRGVFVLTELVRAASGRLGSGYDVEIVEAHHRDKVDAPSGTAWQLAGAVRDVRGGEPVYGRAGRRKAGEIGVSALRGGDVVGEHEVLFLGPGERLVIGHRATTREHFCRGALDAVRFVAGRSAGFYSMTDVFAGGV